MTARRLASRGLSRPVDVFTGPLTPSFLFLEDSPDGAPPLPIVLRGLACPVLPDGRLLEVVRSRQEMTVEDAEALAHGLLRLVAEIRQLPTRNPQR